MKLQSTNAIDLLLAVDADVSNFSKSFEEARHASLSGILNEIGSMNGGDMLVYDAVKRSYTAPRDAYKVKGLDGNVVLMYGGMSANAIIDQYAKVFEDYFNNANPSKWLYKHSETVLDIRFKMSMVDIETLKSNAFANFNIRIGSSWIENGVKVAYVYVTSRSYAVINVIRELLGESLIEREYDTGAHDALEGDMRVSGIVSELKRTLNQKTFGFNTSITVTLPNGFTVSGDLPLGSGKLSKGDAITLEATFKQHSDSHSTYTNGKRVMTFG